MASCDFFSPHITFINSISLVLYPSLNVNLHLIFCISFLDFKYQITSHHKHSIYIAIWPLLLFIRCLQYCNIFSLCVCVLMWSPSSPFSIYWIWFFVIGISLSRSMDHQSIIIIINFQCWSSPLIIDTRYFLCFFVDFYLYCYSNQINDKILKALNIGQSFYSCVCVEWMNEWK